MATITYTVTVATGTNAFSANANKFFINGTVSPTLELKEGNTYIFNQDAASNATHSLRFSATSNGTFGTPPGGAAGTGVEYTTGVTTSGTPGTATAFTQIVVAPVKTVGAPTLFYYCSNHSGMGNIAFTASPTSGTQRFDPAIDDIIEEAYERCGLRTNSGNDIRGARRSLNLLFSEWGNRGVHLWKVQLNEQQLTAGVATYTVPTNVNDVLEAYISSTI